jgi:uncharacterized protein with von Willebrand factor type A (vWA) domain
MVPGLREDAARRLAERQAMVKEMTATEHVGKGPVFVLVDESGSMQHNFDPVTRQPLPEGEGSFKPIEQAKGLALTIAWLCKQQRRWVTLIGFANVHQQNALTLKPGAWDEILLCDWLEHFFNGGTECPVMDMDKFCDWTQAPKGKVDVITITDGAVTIADEQAEAFRAWKAAHGARMITIQIAAHGGDMWKVSDEVHEVPELNVGADGVDSALQI